MPQFIPFSQQDDKPTTLLPLVRLTLREPAGNETALEFRKDSILIGTVPGCDIQLPGGSFPAVIALASVVNDELKVRKLNTVGADQPEDRQGETFLLKPGEQWAFGNYALRLDFLAIKTLNDELRNGAATAGPASAMTPELIEIQAQFERDRREWELEAERQAESLAVRIREVQEQEKQLQNNRREIEELRTGVNEPTLPPDLELVRSELLRLRDSLYHQYRQRRDALIAMREAVRRGAFKVQEAKRALRLEESRQREASAECAAGQVELAERQAEIAKQAKLLEEWQQELERDQRELSKQSDELAAQRAQLEAKTSELHDDLVRLQRTKESLHGRQEHLSLREASAKDRDAHLRAETLKLTALRSDLERTWQKVKDQEQRQTIQGQEIAARSAQLIQKEERCSSDQMQVATQRQRLLEWEHQLGQDRLRLDRLEEELVQRRKQALDELQQWQEKKTAWEEQKLCMEQEITQLRDEARHHHQLRAQREAIEADLASRLAAMEEHQTESVQRASLLQQRTERLGKWRLRLRQQRRALADQFQHVAQSETAHESLQEQLRRRTVALTQREARCQELELSHQQRIQELHTQTGAFSEEKTRWESVLQLEQESLEKRRAALDEQVMQLQKDKGALAAVQQALLEDKKLLEEQQRSSVAEREQVQGQGAALEQAKTKMIETLPNLLHTAQTALERLAQARVQLRTQLQEIHAYRQRCHEEVMSRRQDASLTYRQLDERSQVMMRLQDEQRLEAAALRQDCLQWQAQIEALQTQWRENQHQLAEKSERISTQEKQLEDSMNRLYVRAEELQDRERDVNYRRSEVNRHLADMQDWYRHKLRDMAEKKLHHQSQTGEEEPDEQPSILPLKSTHADTDHHLADLLSSMGLIDAVTLQSILDEARQKHVTLRDCLIQNEFLTRYQMELIEEGRLEALVLGPLRVIDRIRSGAMETIYRVYDPRQGDEALLRHLSPSTDRHWQAEYRSLFHQAALIHHPNVAATLDVLEMNNSPAILQEWLLGLAATEWQTLVVEPSVALRLIIQAAQGLTAVHQADLVHGQLHSGRLLLTPSGDLKLCGAGEPAWLNGLTAAQEPTAEEDVAELCIIVLPWCRAKGRQQLPSALGDFVAKLESQSFTTAHELLSAAYAVQRSIPQDDAAWRRLLHFVHDRLYIPETVSVQKKSA